MGKGKVKMRRDRERDRDVDELVAFIEVLLVAFIEVLLVAFIEVLPVALFFSVDSTAVLLLYLLLYYIDLYSCILQ